MRNFFSPNSFFSLTPPIYHDVASDGGGGGSSSFGSASSQGGFSGSAASGNAGAAGQQGGQQSGGQQGGGRQAAGGQQGGQQQQQGQGGPAPFEFSDTARIRMPDGRIITGAEYNREQEERIHGVYRGRYENGFNILLREAQRLDSLRGQGQQQGQGGQQPQAGARSPLADLENVPLVEGRHLTQAVRFLQENGLAPIANMITQLTQRQAASDKLLNEFRGRFGSQDEEAEAAKFGSRLDQVLPNIEIKGFNGRIDPRDPAVRQLAENLYLSYHTDSWKAGEFEKMLGELMTGLYQSFQNMQRSVVTTARDRLRQHFNPNRGGGQPSGGQKYQFETPRQMAARMREAGMFETGQSRIGT